MSNNLIQIEELCFRYPGMAHPALGPLNLGVRPGELLVVVGPSGCGKSTLLRLLAGLEKPETGRIELGGCELSGPKSWVAPEKRPVGMIFQDFALFPHLTVAQNIRFGLKGKTAPIKEMLKLTELSEFEHRYPHQLSGGQQQRLAVARALAPHPQVLLLDEPFSNFDRRLSTQLSRDIRQLLKSISCTAVLVTHDREIAMTVGDRVVVMRDGCIEQCDTPLEIYHHPRSAFVAEFFGMADLLPVEINDTTLTSELGCVGERNGHDPDRPLQLLVRPENLEVRDQPFSHAVPADVVAVRSTAMSQIHCLRLPSGARVHTATVGLQPLAPGNRVYVRLKIDEPMLFPVEPSAREE